jgi:hypothetical protein
MVKEMKGKREAEEKNPPCPPLQREVGGDFSKVYPSGA